MHCSTTGPEQTHAAEQTDQRAMKDVQGQNSGEVILRSGCHISLSATHRRCSDVDEHLAPAERHGQWLRACGQDLAGLAAGLAHNLSENNMGDGGLASGSARTEAARACAAAQAAWRGPDHRLCCVICCLRTSQRSPHHQQCSVGADMLRVDSIVAGGHGSQRARPGVAAGWRRRSRPQRRTWPPSSPP